MMTTKTIEELSILIKTGKTPSTRDKLNFENGDYNWFTPGDFKTSKVLKESKRKITDYATKNNAVIYQPNTILITCIGDIGNAGIIKEESSANQQITGVVVNENIINPEFFLYWVKANKQQIQDEANQAVVPIINNKGLKRIKVTFPSDLPTQSKIVAILDKAISLVRKREETIALLGELLSSQFLEMFGDPILNPKSWDVLDFKEVAQNENSKRVPIKKADRTVRQGKYPYYGATGIIDSIDDYKFDGNYLLIAEDGKNLLFRKKDNAFLASGKFWVNNHAHVLSDNGVTRLTYLMNFFNFLNLKAYITGIDQVKLNKANLEKIPISVPPIELQNQFETIYHKIQTQKETLFRSKTELENLYNSLLQRAFNGQLNFNIDIELDALLAAIDLEQDTEKEKYDIKEIATVYAGRLLERIEEQKFENNTQYKQAKEVVFQMLKEGAVQQEYDKVSKSVKLKLV